MMLLPVRTPLHTTIRRYTLGSIDHFQLTARRIAWIAVVARSVWCVWAWFSGVRPASDARWYYERALEIAAGHGFSINGNPTAYWPVGYPGFLGGLFSVVGDSIPIAMAMNVLFGVAIVEGTRRLATILFKSERAGLFAGLIVALHPNGIAYSSLLMGETLSAALIVWSVLFLLEIRERVGWKVVVGALLLAGAIIVRPQTAPIPAVLILTVVFVDRPRGPKRLLLGFGLAYAGAFLLLVPWTLRNQSIFDVWPILSNNDGINLHIGNNSRANGTYYIDFVVESAYWDAPNEYLQNVQARDSAIAWVKSHPTAFLGLIPRKLWYLWRADAEGFSWNRRWFRQEVVTAVTRVYDALKWGSQAWWIVFLALFGWTILRYSRKGPYWSWVGVSVVVWISILGSVYFGDGRFHFVAIPFMATLVGQGLAVRSSELTEKSV